MPLRFPRPLLALIATGTVAAFSIGLTAIPAQADPVRAHEWWLRSLGVTGAWATSQGSGVTVAVLSDGVGHNLPDLAGVVSSAPALAGAPIASGQYFGADGTPIASLIAGRGHGSGGRSGIIGVAPQAEILSVQVTLPANDPALSSAASTIPAAIAAGIRYAVGHGATVIDLPIDPGQPGASGTGGAAAAAGGSAAEKSAVTYALQHNVVLVAPAGDDATSTDGANYPAAYSGVISVGAFNSEFVKAPWSSHQSYVTVTAAGAGVKAAANSGQYVTMNSTSAASAVVAGIAALIRSRYPHLSATDVSRALTTSTVFRPAHGHSDGSGFGTVNADNALAAAAVLATPGSQKAGRNARPLLAPAAIPATSATQSLESQLVKAGEDSGALLAVLLLLTAAYALTGRRRPAAQQAVAPEWMHRQSQSRYPQARGTDADRMLEVFAAPLADPRVIGAGSAMAALPAGSSGAGPAMFAPSGGRQDAGLTTDDGTVDTGRVLTHGPASRAVSRRPAVSGAPPWEPAAPPKSELPWTAGPSPESGPGWAAPDRQRELPAGSADPGIAALFRPAEPADSGSYSFFRNPEPADPGSDSPFPPAGQLGRQEPAADSGQRWLADELSRRAAASRPADSWAGHSRQFQAGGTGESWHGGEPARSWSDFDESHVPDWPGAPWPDRLGQSGPGEAPGFVRSEALSSESWGAEQPAESWQREQPAESWGVEQPAASWGAEQPAQSWPAQEHAESWQREEPSESRGAVQPSRLWAGASGDPAGGAASGRASGGGADLPWTINEPEEATGASVPSRPGQHRIAPSGLPVRQPGATHQTGGLSPTGSLWERAEPGGSLWERADSGHADETGDWIGRGSAAE